MDSQKKYTALTKEEIVTYIKQAQSSDSQAFELLQTQYRPLIDSQVHKYFSEGMGYDDGEDLRQEALIAFHSAVMNYDCSEDVEFGLYAKICIGNGLKTYLREYKKRSRQGVIPLEDINAEDTLESEEPSSDLICRESMQQLVTVIRDSLSTFEARVWWLYVSGLSAADVAKRLDLGDVRSVENAIYRIRRKLRKLLGD